MEINAESVRWALNVSTEGLQEEPYFFTLEGGEGSGKTTLMNKLKDTLIGILGEDNVVFVREPGGTEIAEEIREIVVKSREGKSSVCPITQVLLMCASRAQAINEIIGPALKAGKVVVCDRYLDSTIVYQILLQDIDAHLVSTLLKHTPCPLPRKTIILDVNAEIGLRRANGGFFEDKGVEFATRVNTAYRLLAEENSYRFHVINTSSSSEDEVYNDAIGAILGLLPNYAQESASQPEMPQEDYGTIIVTQKELETEPQALVQAASSVVEAVEESKDIAQRISVYDLLDDTPKAVVEPQVTPRRGSRMARSNRRSRN